MAEKILVVDDDLDTLRLVGLMLQRQGYEIVAANNGSQALAMAQSEHPDLILLDVMMPDLDGVEVTRRLRANEATRDLPIIMFTAKTQVEDKILGFEAGVDDYLTKPTQPRELFAHVRAVLARAGKAKTGTAPLLDRGYSIGLLSTRGGLGVSTLTVNLGIALSQLMGKSVIVTDFRPGQGTISLDLGVLNSEGFNRLLQRKPAELDARAIDTELVSHPSGIRLLIAIARQLVYMARYVLFDLGPGLSPVAEQVLQYLDALILVVEPVPQTVLQTRTLIEDLKAKGIGDGRIEVAMINRVRSGIQLSSTQVQEQLGHSVAAIFTPAPELAYQSAQNNMPMMVLQPQSITAQQFVKLAERVAQRHR
jgi:pilus assembly protein CpaE